jgi:Domain of unknown function (DUF6362)
VSTARTPVVVGPLWTPTLVAERLAEAADVLDRLPEPRLRGFYSLLPLLPDAPAGDGARTRPAAPAPEAIDRMDEALGWLCWLDPEERRLVWLRADGMPWKWITHRFGIGRTTAWQRWTIALLKITTRLNAAAEQDRSNTKPLNKRADSVLERGEPQTRSGRPRAVPVE